MKNLQWTDLELLDRGIESYPELVITDEIMMDMPPNGSLTGIGVKQKEEVGNYSPEVVVGWAQQPMVSRPRKNHFFQKGITICLFALLVEVLLLLKKYLRSIF